MNLLVNKKIASVSYQRDKLPILYGFSKCMKMSIFPLVIDITCFIRRNPTKTNIYKMVIHFLFDSVVVKIKLKIRLSQHGSKTIICRKKTVCLSTRVNTKFMYTDRFKINNNNKYYCVINLARLLTTCLRIRRKYNIMYSARKHINYCYYSHYEHVFYNRVHTI